MMGFEEIEIGLNKDMEEAEKKFTKRCPFCGSEEASVEAVRVSNGKKWWYVQCKKCFASSSAAESVEKAVQKWNTRHDPPTPGGAVVPAGNDRLHKQEFKECNIPRHFFDMYRGGCNGYCCKTCAEKRTCEVVCVEAFKDKCVYEVKQ